MIGKGKQTHLMSKEKDIFFGFFSCVSEANLAWIRKCTA